MRNRVLIQKKNPNATADASGHVDYSLAASWSNVGKYYCNIFTRGGRERWRFNQVEAEVDRIVEVRSSTTTRALTPEHRLRFTQDGVTTTWDVKAAFDRDALRETVEIHCTEVK